MHAIGCLSPAFKFSLCCLTASSVLAGTSASRGAESDFSGTWRAEKWGRLELRQQGSKVVGSYEYSASATEKQYGHVEGDANGNQVVLRWWQSTQKVSSYEGAMYRGDGYLFLSPDGNDLIGKWRAEGTADWADDWSYVRE